MKHELQKPHISIGPACQGPTHVEDEQGGFLYYVCGTREN
jgi:hypothetical protein